MSEMVEFTDEEINAIRFWAKKWDGQSDITPDYRPHLSSLIRSIEAKLPKRLDPRNLPPGPELDVMVCEAMGLHPGHGMNCQFWSTKGIHIGQMLDWLHECKPGSGYRISTIHTNEIIFKWWSGGLPSEEVQGITVAHALARAIAIIGGQQ